MPNYIFHPSKLSPESVVEIVHRYRIDPSTSTTDLAAEYGCSAVVVAKYLRRNIPPDEYHGLKLLRNPTHPGSESVELKRKVSAERSYAFRHRVNHECFADDLTAEKAYWIGFLLADGCVSDDRICLALQQSDIGHVEKFRRFVCGEFYSIKLTSSNNACNLRFVSHKMAADLARYGIVPRKSLTGDFAVGVTDDFMWHYLRGFFDGDGSVHIGSRNRLMVQMSGSYSFCLKLVQWLVSHGIGAIGPYMRRGTQVCTIQIQSRHACNFLTQIYSSSTEAARLDRKFNKVYLDLRILPTIITHD